MTNVNKTLDQLSGFLKLIATPLPNLVSISGETVSVRSADMVFEIEASAESISFQSKPELGTQGHLFKHSVDAFLRGQSDQVSRILEFMIRYKHLVVLMDQDGNYLRVGDMVNGLSFDFDLSPSPDPNGENGYKLSFSGNTLGRHLPVLYPFLIQ